MVHAAHYPEHHHKDDPIYDTPEAGDIRCIEHHKEQHLGGTTLGPTKDAYAVRKLEETDPHTYDYHLHPENYQDYDIQDWDDLTNPPEYS